MNNMTEQEQEITDRLSSIDRQTQLLAESIPASANQKGRCPTEAKFSDHYRPQNRLFLFLHIPVFSAGLYYLGWWFLPVIYCIVKRFTIDALDEYRCAKLDARESLRQANEDPVYKKYDELAAALKIPRPALTFEIIRIVQKYAKRSAQALAEAEAETKAEAERERLREKNAIWLANRPKVLLDRCAETWALFFDNGMPGIADWLLHKRTGGQNWLRVAGTYTLSPVPPAHPIADRWLARELQQNPQARPQNKKRSQQNRNGSERGTNSSSNSNRSGNSYNHQYQEPDHYQPPPTHNAFPDVNTNGLPMIEGTNIDIHGHTYGAGPDM